MFKNRFVLAVAVLSILFVTLAVSSPLGRTIPVTGADERSEYTDYYQRHSERSVSAEAAIDLSDYFIRHPEAHVLAESVDLSDYFLRH
jgi:hypothetical protein